MVKKRLATKNKVNPFEKKTSNKHKIVSILHNCFVIPQVKQTTATIRNITHSHNGKKRRFQLVDSSDSEADGLSDIDTLGPSNSNIAYDQTRDSELSKGTKNKNKKEVMAQVIAKSKQFKAEKKQEKQLLDTIVENIDEEFMQILPSLPRKNRNKESTNNASVASKGHLTQRKLQTSQIGEDMQNQSEQLSSTENNGQEWKESDFAGMLKNHDFDSEDYDNNRLITIHESYTNICGSESSFEQKMNGLESSLDQNNDASNFPKTFEEFLSRLLSDDILQENYLNDLVSQTIGKHSSLLGIGNSEQLLAFMFRALQVIASQGSDSDSRVRTLETIKTLVEKIRTLMSSENVKQLEIFMDIIIEQLSEPLFISIMDDEDKDSVVGRSDWILDLSDKLDFRLFLLLFSVSRLSSLKNTISPTIKNFIFLIGQWLTRMKVSCLHQLRKGLSLIELFLPHIEAARCFVPEFLTYCFSVVSLFRREDSRVRDTTSLYQFCQSESLQHVINQVIRSNSSEGWSETDRKDVLLSAFECNDVSSCKSIASNNSKDLSNTLCDLIVSCREIVVRFSTLLQSFDAFHSLIFPLLEELREISEDQQVSRALRTESKSFASKLEEMVRSSEKRGLKPLKLLYNKKFSLPVEYEPKWKAQVHQQERRHLKQHLRKEKQKTMKWLHSETKRQQQKKLLQKGNEDLYRTKRAQEALNFLQQQQTNWNKQEKKWKNTKKSLS